MDRPLARRLLDEPGKGAADTTQAEMEAALLRLNPHLAQIGQLPKGTPVLVPEEFGLARKESTQPLHAMTEALLQQSEHGLTNLHHSAHSAAQTERVRAWLKGDQAKEFVRSAPALKEVFASAAAAAKTLPKGEAATSATHSKALEGIQTALAEFRARAAVS